MVLMPLFPVVLMVEPCGNPCHAQNESWGDDEGQ
jgi:hypothetical protein